MVRSNILKKQNLFNGLLLLVVLLMGSACSTTPRPKQDAPVVVDVIDRSADKPDTVVQPRRTTNPIVVAGLQRDAHDLNKAGKSAKAAAILERAIRIQPRNPQLWHDLAQVRYTQERYQQAESLALRSNRYAARQADLKRANWRLIAKSREKLGNNKGAAAARKQAN